MAGPVPSGSQGTAERRAFCMLGTTLHILFSKTTSKETVPRHSVAFSNPKQKRQFNFKVPIAGSRSV